MEVKLLRAILDVEEMNGVHTFDVEVLDELLFLFGRVFTCRLGCFHVASASSPCSDTTNVLDALKPVLLGELDEE